ncbi:hypothetical protein [Vibrio parahaemolyticus]|uniref:hypothetical protein n=1 Tax=Vibrio parahaemolyticus TaxID=670 RepID=UPI0025544E2C|nr:hypothetical protein [Vibrio parahaemolyticus]
MPYTRKYPLHVPTTLEAEALLDAFGKDNRKAMRNAESMERSLLNRAEENARRLSLLYWMDHVCPTDGSGNFTDENKIQVEHVEKAIDFVKWSLNYTLNFMADEAGATTTSKEVDRIIAIVRQAKMYGKTRKDSQFDAHRSALDAGYMPRSVLLKLSKKSAKHLDGLLETAGGMEAIGIWNDPTSGKAYYVAL